MSSPLKLLSTTITRTKSLPTNGLDGSANRLRGSCRLRRRHRPRPQTGEPSGSTLDSFDRSRLRRRPKSKHKQANLPISDATTSDRSARYYAPLRPAATRIGVCIVSSRTPMRSFRCHDLSRGTRASKPIHRSWRREVGNSRGRPKSVPMSAAEGVVLTDTLGPAPTRETRFTAIPPSGAVSPELALIDADLARELRARLTEPAPPSRSSVGETVHAQAALVGRLRQELEPEPLQPPPEGGRGSRKLRVLGLVVLGALLTVFVRNEARPSALDRIAGVAADRNAQAQTPAQGVRVAAVTAGSTLAGQTFVWAAEPGAAAYEFQLFRGDDRIYRARVTAPRLVLPGRWHQQARSYALTAATYRWYVWPISARTGNRAPVATVQATLIVARPSR